jgi:hypothetical protein
MRLCYSLYRTIIANDEDGRSQEVEPGAFSLVGKALVVRVSKIVSEFGSRLSQSANYLLIAATAVFLESNADWVRSGNVCSAILGAQSVLISKRLGITGVITRLHREVDKITSYILGLLKGEDRSTSTIFTELD